MLAQRILFDLTCPVCGHDCETVALGTPRRMESAMTVRCSAANCRCEWQVRAQLIPMGQKSVNRLRSAINRGLS